jgi:hypothetical protein
MDVKHLVTWLAFRLCCGRRCVLAAAFAATSFLGGCAHLGQPLEPVPDRMNRTVAEAVKASADALSAADIAKRAVENADACRCEAEEQLAEAMTNDGPGRVGTAEATLKGARKEAAETREKAAEIAVHVANATNEVAAVKKLAEQAVAAGQAQAKKLAGKAQHRGDRCRKEAEAARRLSDGLKRRWLSLSPAPSLEPPRTNGVATSASNNAPGDRVE